VGQSGRERRASAVPYWALAIALIGFGVVAIFSIGLPFLALGLALVVLAPVRTARRCFGRFCRGSPRSSSALCSSRR
jgi:hypothetical protein